MIEKVYLNLMADSRSQEADAAIERLHGATRDLIDAQTRTELAEVSVAAATDVLGFPYSVVWYATPDRSALEAAAVSDPLAEYVPDPENPGETMRHERGSWMWSLYEAGESQRVTIAEEQTASETPVHSGIVVPLGEYGMLTAGRTDRHTPTEHKHRLADILGKNLQTALTRTDRERQLQEQRDALRTLNRIVRHDIRNDLQPVIAYAEHLADHLDEETDAAETILRRAESAVDLTETAREFARAMLGTDEDLEPVPLHEAVVPELEAARDTHERATVSVAGGIPDVGVVADGMLGSAVHNLVENAVRHNDAATPAVTVSATVHADRVVLRVADNGPGVPLEVRDTLFEREVKGPRSDGTGIGLSLVETVVTRYGGEVWLETDPEDPPYGADTGAVFALALPRAE